MFVHFILLVSLSWMHNGVDGTDLKDELALDQIATASEISRQNAKGSEEKSEDFRNQLIPSMIDASAHYGNSNDLMPIVVASLPKRENLTVETSSTSFASKANDTSKNIFFSDLNNSSSDDGTKEIEEAEEGEEQGLEVEVRKSESIEDDPAYSTEARFLFNLPQSGTNRRSFDFQGNQNEFELLKVRNNTPAVANYQDFYENVQTVVENSKDEEDNSGIGLNEGGGTKIEDHFNYGTLQTHNGDSSFDIYYPYNFPEDEKKPTYELEKVAINYREQDAVEYDGHGQSSTRQNGPAPSSLIRTHQEINELTKDTLNNYNQSFSNLVDPSGANTARHRFSRPVVVAEPSNYKVDFKYSDQPSAISNSNMNNYQTSRVIESSSSEMGGRYAIYSREGRFRTYGRDDDSRDASDVSADYSDYTERPKRIQKGRRRPYVSESSRRLPKEHRTSAEDSSEYEEHGKRHHSSRSKSHRHRVKSHSWSDEDRNRGKGESFEETRHEGRTQSGSSTKGTKTHPNSNFRPSNAWNQITPNLEISHSSGIEIDQMNKPKLILPLNVNFVPMANFDHATALGNSQGFDMSNALLQNAVTAAPVSTGGNHLLNTQQTVFGHTLGVQNVVKNIPSIGVSTPMSDIVVDQSTFQNPLQTMLFPQTTGQNKFSSNLRPQYISTTVSPIYAVTPTLSSAIQSVPGQNTVSPRPSYLATPTPSTTAQHISLNQIQPGFHQLIVPQPTLQALPSLLHSVQSLPLVTTVAPAVQPIAKVNLLKANTQNKKSVLPGSTASFLATANLAVGHNEQKQSSGSNSYYLQNTNIPQVLKGQSQDAMFQYVKSVDVTPKTKTYLHATHVMPTVVHPLPSIATFNTNPQQVMSVNNNQNILRYHSNGVDNTIQQMQLHLQRDQLLKANRLSNFGQQSVDSLGSTSNSNVNAVNTLPGLTGIVENAHLPYVGTRNVEILNPNIKPSPMDTTLLNTYETVHYPTAVLTTPIPMFSTTSFVTARPAVISTTTSEVLNPQSYVDTLTELGAKANQFSTSDLKVESNQERPMYNPINFVPNMDVVKSQSALNTKLQSSEPLQPNLNLVPLIPGGNFFKPSFNAQSELIVKPKLTSDLEKYAEQMFKESLKTMYQSQKWNNDRKPGSRQNISDTNDLAKLKSELQRLKASLSESNNNKDIYEGLHSENRIKIAELLKSTNLWDEKKKPDQLVAALEQMLKTHAKDHGSSHRGRVRPGHSHKHHQHDFDDDFKDSKHPRESFSPPKVRLHGIKSHIHDKPAKKRPGSGRLYHHHHHHGSRPHSRPRQMSMKSTGLETAASNIDLGYHSDVPFENIPHRYLRDRDVHELRQGSFSFDSYPSITTAKPDPIDIAKLRTILKSHQDKDFDINHPRTHNLMGLLMKNKQLPTGNRSNYFRDKDQLRQFFEDEKQRQQQQFYDDALRDYLAKSSRNNAFYDVNRNGSRKSFTGQSKT